MNPHVVLLLTLACASCTGRIEQADTTTDAGTTPAPVAVGDAGLTCSVPTVSTGIGGAATCTFVTTCTGSTGSFAVQGKCFESNGAVVRCSVNGDQTTSFTTLATCDCTNPSGLVAVAVNCMQ